MNRFRKGLSTLHLNEVSKNFGSRKNIEAHYQRVFPLLRTYIQQNQGNVDDAKDIFQDAMSITWKNLLDGRVESGTDGTLDAYIMQIAKRRWLDRLRSASFKKELPLHDQDTAHDPESNEDTLTEVQRLRSSFAALGDKCRELLGLFYYRGLDLSEIGEELGHDASTVRTMKYRCMQKLKKLAQR